MSADFTPEKEDYKILTPFKMQVLTNFPYIEADFDALTNYQLLCKIVEYLNNVIHNENELTAQVNSLYNAYVSLQNYVNNYFDNLDVQEEINNKLDDMARDGSLQDIVGSYIEEDINPIIDYQNNEINTIKNQVNALASGNPLAASSTSDMIDTTKIYVNTTDGYWYYYNGDAWAQGGIYQSNVYSPESINYIMLDDTLKEMYIENLTFIDMGDYIEGKIPKGTVGNTIVFDTSQYFSYYKIDISSYIGKVLHYNSQSMETYQGCIITDSSDEIVYATTGTGSHIAQDVSGYIIVNNDMKYMYLLVNASVNNNKGYLFANLGVINNLKLKLIYNKATELEIPLKEYTYGYIDGADITNNLGQLKYKSINNASCNFNIFKMYNGYKYTINAINMASDPNRAGFVICDNNFNVITASTTLYGTGERFNHTFTANFNGYICTTTDRTYNNQKAIVYQYDDMDNNESSLFSSLKIGFTGDSICAGDGYSGGYATILHDNYGLEVQNIGVSGGHITHDRDDVFIISDSIDDLDNNCDAYIIEGGINDYANNVTFGDISSNYTDSVDDTTFVGALEKTFRALYTYHSGKKFAFLIIHNVLNYYCIHQGNKKTWKDYCDVIHELGRKYGVDIIDIGNQSMNTYDVSIKSSYTANSDGLHPNQNGYNKFYIPAIKEWIEKNLL